MASGSGLMSAPPAHPSGGQHRARSQDPFGGTQLANGAPVANYSYDLASTPTSSSANVASAMAGGDPTPSASSAAAVVAIGSFSATEEEPAGWDANKLNHIFGNPEHGLGGLVDSLGGESAVMDAAQESLEGADLPSSGLFEVTRTIGGESVTIRGAVVDGVPKIGTMFIPPS